MKVLHILTLVTPDGAYGGPARVAVNQCSALADRGHEVTLAAGHSGFATVPTSVGGVPARLFPASRVVPGLGYAATRATGMGPWIDCHRASFDIAHVHLARDLVTLPAVARLRKHGVPYVVQTHGMITPKTHPLATIVDTRWTITQLRSARAVFYLNDDERDALTRVAGRGIELRHLANGVPIPSRTLGLDAVCPPEVLFLARLHPRKRPDVFAHAALILLRRGIDAQFAVVGPQEGAEAAVDDIIAEARSEGFDASRLRREGPVAPSEVSERMARASVYVLTAEREPFGMSVVEALAVGVPAVIRGDGGLADFVRRHDCGLVVDGDAAQFADAIAQLLSDPQHASRSGELGRIAVAETYGMASVAHELEDTYRPIAVGGRHDHHEGAQRVCGGHAGRARGGADRRRRGLAVVGIRP